MYVFMKENSDSGNENEVVNRSQLKAEWFIILFRGYQKKCLDQEEHWSNMI